MRLMDYMACGIYVFVGAIAWVMAWRNLRKREPMEFYLRAGAINWEQLVPGLQRVVLSMMRVIGMGFLVVGAMLFIQPAVMYMTGNGFLRTLLPFCAWVYCGGLFAINRMLEQKTGFKTPWRGSLLASVGIGVGMVLGLLA